MQEENKDDIWPHIERIGNVIVVHSDYPTTPDFSRAYESARRACDDGSWNQPRVVDTPKPPTPKLPLDDEPLTLRERKKLLKKKKKQ